MIEEVVTILDDVIGVLEMVPGLQVEAAKLVKIRSAVKTSQSAIEFFQSPHGKDAIDALGKFLIFFGSAPGTEAIRHADEIVQALERVVI